MTRATREHHINQALVDYRSRPPGTVDTSRVPLRGKSVLLEVVDLPLDVPILNADSFRIAPALADHSQRELVERDPESGEAQAVIAQLVRKSHRNAEKLKESLMLDGQDQPGVVTRNGKLINANTRCVLLRELVAEGKLKSASLRVAVLPPDTINSEELGLESILQQQQEYKDDYNFVSKLMMIQKLYTDANMSDKQIAMSLREKGGAKRIADLREVLVLMHRARNLSSPPRSLSVFVTQKDQQQNWLELLYDVRDIENRHGRPVANDHIRGWLLAFYSGFDSVHQLRSARGHWVERDVLVSLAEGGATSIAVARAASTPVEAPDSQPTRPAGLDYLNDQENEKLSPPSSSSQNLLNIVVGAATAEMEVVSLPNGETVRADETLEAVRASVEVGLDATKRRMAGQNKLARPQAQADQASRSLKAALESLEEVIDEPEFGPYKPDLSETVATMQVRIDDILDLMSDDENRERDSEDLS